MPRATGISDAEWEVIKVLWDQGPLQAGQIVAALEKSTHWKPRTIKTLLGRLVKKHVVRVEHEENRFVYRAAITRHAAARREVRSLLSRVFDGALAPALVAFLNQSDLSSDQVEDLRKIFEREVKR